MGKLSFTEEGRIRGWVWLGLFSLVYLILIVSCLISDSAADRLSKVQVIVSAGLPAVLGSYAYSKRSKHE